MNATFRTTGQALDVSFLINSLEPTEKNGERISLIRILDSLPRLTDEQQRWLEQLIGERSGNVNFEELSPVEIRGQAVLVIAAVRDHLHPAESAAVIGSYTRNAIEKASAVRYLSEYLKPAVYGRDRLIADYTVLRCLPTKESKMARPPEEIIRHLGLNAKEAAAHVREMKKKVTPLRLRGESNLDERFKRDGLVATEEDAYA